MTRPVIAVIKETKLCTSAEVRAFVKAQQIQIDRDFSADYGRSAQIVYGHRTGAWPIYLRDQSDVPGALGYHELYANVPRGFVFLADDAKYGLRWSVTASHEILETIGDPTADLVMPYPNGDHVADESCDAVEADRFGYRINGVLLSNFVYRAWYTGTVRPTSSGHPYDYSGALTAPLTMAPGGYLAIERNGQWTQIFAQSDPGTHSRRLSSLRHGKRFP